MDFKDVENGMPNDYFWIRAKRNFIAQTLEQQQLPANAKILDVGAGIGDDLKVLAQFGSLYVIDIDPQVLTCAVYPGVAEVKVADICGLPYADNFFDAIVCFDVLEHVLDDRRAVVELYRVLKPGGRIVITVPAYQFLFSQHDKDLGHYRRYTKATVKKLFTCVDLQEKTISYWFSILFVPASLLRLFTKNKKNTTIGKFPYFLNSFFYCITSIENFLIKLGIRFPFGLSVWAVFYKKQLTENKKELTNNVPCMEKIKEQTCDFS